jgi:hypothetical protein
MSREQLGDPVKGEVSSADAHSGVTVLLYKAGSTSAYTLKSNEYLNVTDILLCFAASGSFALVANTDTAGKRLAKGSIGTASFGSYLHHFETPLVCPVGVTPVLIADAAMGQIDLILSGFITEV